MNSTNEPQLRRAISATPFQEEHLTIRDDQQIAIQINELQHQLIEMGFDINLLNKVILYFEVTSLEMALDYLTKENGKWNHPFVNIEDLNVDICIVCNDLSSLHRTHFFNPAHSSMMEQPRMNDAEQRDLDLPRKNRSFEPIFRYNSQKKQSKEIEIIDDKRKIFCNICMSEIERPFQSGCEHQYCRECMVDYIKNKIYSSDVEDIDCPEGKAKCGNIIGEDVIKTLLDGKDIERYYKFLNRAKISKITNSVFCPILDCNSYAIKPSQHNAISNSKTAPDSNLPIFLTCIENNHFFCLKCKQLAHYGIKCDLKFEKEFNSWVGREDVRPCPQCGFFIQKNEGCNHMICGNKSCNYQFCWICMREYTGAGHYKNPLLPCYGMMFFSQRNILVKHPWLRFIKHFFLLLLILLLFCIAVSLASILIMFYLMMLITDKYPNPFIGLGKCLRPLVILGTTFGLGVAFLPMGYSLVIVAIAVLPFMGLAFLLKKCCCKG